MVRKPSSLSYRSSLTRRRKSSLLGPGFPLLMEAGFEHVFWKDSDDSVVVGFFEPEEWGMKSVGTTCSKGRPFARLTFKA